MVTLKEYSRGFIGQRAVDDDTEAIVPMDQLLCLDLPDKKQKLLCPADRKGWNDYIAASVKCFLYAVGELSDEAVAGVQLFMKPVAVCGLNHDIVGCGSRFRIVQKRLVFVADVPREDHLLCHIAFCHPHFNGGRSQKMPYVGKPYVDSIKDLNPAVVRLRYETLGSSFSILYSVDRLYNRST